MSLEGIPERWACIMHVENHEKLELLRTVVFLYIVVNCQSTMAVLNDH